MSVGARTSTQVLSAVVRKGLITPGAWVLGAALAASLSWVVAAQWGGAAPAVTSPGTTVATTPVGVASDPAPAATLAQVEGVVAASVRVDSMDRRTMSQLSRVTEDRADVIDSLPINCPGIAPHCVFGDATSHNVVVLFGDSHARMWLPAIIPVARADHLKVVVVGRDGCPLVAPGVASHFGSCGAVITRDVATIDAMRPAAIILSDRTTYGGISDAQWQAGLSRTIADLATSRAHVAVIGDIQVFDAGQTSYLLSCLVNHPHSVQACDVPNPNPAAPGHETAEVAAAAGAGDLYVNPTPWLCTPTTCSPVIGGNIVYWDAFHITAKYATYLSGVMGGALGPFLTSAVGDHGPLRLATWSREVGATTGCRARS